MRNTNIGEVAEVLVGTGITPELARTKAGLLVHNQHVATSGKMAAGKDAVADAYCALIGATNVVHLSMAMPLKTEVTDLIRAYDAQAPKQMLAEKLGVSPADIGKAYDQLEGIEPGATGYSRDPRVRGLLQVWGTDIRRASDDMYWTRLGVAAIATAVVEGATLKITDARFTNEVEMLQSVGIPVVRLEVTPETQDRRHFERDGAYPDPEKRVHISETELDDYIGFDCVIDNNEDRPFSEVAQLILDNQVALAA